MGRSVEQLLERVEQEAADKLHEILSADWPPASGPGEPPRRRTGALADAYTVDAVLDGETVTVTLTPGVGYADFLEFGTARMAARPHRQTVADYLAQTLPDRLGEAVTFDLLETLEPQGSAESPAAGGFFGRAAAAVGSLFGF